MDTQRTPCGSRLSGTMAVAVLSAFVSLFGSLAAPVGEPSDGARVSSNQSPRIGSLSSSTDITVCSTW